MKVIPDLAARMTALTAVDRTLLVEAGAPVTDACPCANHESALWAAVNIGAAPVICGSPPPTTAFAPRKPRSTS